MRKINFISLGILVFLPLLVFATSNDLTLSERALREECSTGSQAGIRDCLAKKVEESQKGLRRSEANLSNVLSKWDEDDKYIILAKDKLDKSSKEFIKYRQSQCEFSSALGGGAAGNTYEIRRLACVAELNSKRSKQLRDFVDVVIIK
ncbi:MAG: lysozyme inhibitor LprI family protein [Pseudomonadota bacterium]